MATPTEVARVIEYCEERWPGTRAFRHAEKAAWDFAGIPAKALHAAAHAHFAAGERNAPTLSQLRAEGARQATQMGLTDPQATNCDTRGHHGNWAVEDLRDNKGRIKTDDNGSPLREAMCVDCQTTIIRPARHLLTAGEAKEAAEAASEPADTLSDKVAP